MYLWSQVVFLSFNFQPLILRKNLLNYVWSFRGSEWKVNIKCLLIHYQREINPRMLLKAFALVSSYHLLREIDPYLKESVIWFYYYWWMLPLLIQIIHFQGKLFLSKDDPSSFIIIKWDSYLILSVLHMSLVQCEVFVKCLFLTIYAR